MSPSACGELSERIYRISGGTPQFIKELLSALHKEKCIRFNIQEWQWQWDMASIETFRVSEDIMELLDRSIQKLTPACVDMLGMAACIGTVFDSGLLARAGQIPGPQLTGLLSEAAAAGLIASHPDNGYVFVHDRILQAVRESLPADSLQRMHYRIGMYLLEQLPDEERREQLYDLVNHLNAGLACLPAAKRRLLAELNLGAGRKAKSSNAFHTGLTFLRFGVGLLVGDAWKSDYALTFALHREWLECEYLCGNYEQTKQLFDSLIEHVGAPLERAGMHVILALNYRRYNHSIEAIDAGMKGLEELAFRFPTAPSQLRLIGESAMTWLTMRKVRLEDIPDLPSAQDEEARIAAQLMAIISPCAYLTSPELLAMIGFRLTRLSLMEKLEQSQEQVRSGIKEIKKALKMLREGVEAEEFSPSLEMFIQDTIHKTGVVIRYKLDSLPPLTSGQKYVLYRALQEGITNGIRHGGSMEFEFTLKLEDGLLQFQLVDCGSGNHTIRFGSGLTAMKERVEELGGSLQVAAHAGKGCRLQIDIPYRFAYSK